MSRANSLYGENYSNTQFIKDLWFFFRKYKFQFIFYTILLAVAYGLELIPPIILAKIVDFFGTNYTTITPFYNMLWLLLGIMVLATILRHISKYFLGIFSIKVQKFVRVETFQRMIQNDLFWHEARNTGEKVEKLNGGRDAIARFMRFYTNQALNIIVNFIGIVTVFSFFSFKYSLITVVYISVYLLFEFKLNKQVSNRSYHAQIAKEFASGKAHEFSSNITTVKSLGIEKKTINQIEDAEDSFFQKRVLRNFSSSKKWVSVSLVSVIFYSLYLFFIGRDVFAGILTVGSIVVYVEYIRRIRSNILGNISSQALNLIDTKQGMNRMMEIYYSLPEIDEINAKSLLQWKKIAFENVSFSYGRKLVLKNFNLEIKKGEKIGIAGTSGGGKSTFFKLLLKLYLPKSGKILFDKKDNRLVTRESILEKISIVPQDTELFNLSLRDNIKLSKNGRFDNKKYKEAIQKSQLSDLISKLKFKDLTKIGEKGFKLSGGERQRLGIARAIYKDSDIIILDEATPNLDYETEKKFQKAIDLIKGKTIIVAAHRLTTLQNMDRIIFIKDGKIVEQGTYNELIDRKGKFYNLWKSQNY